MNKIIYIDDKVDLHNGYYYVDYAVIVNNGITQAKEALFEDLSQALEYRNDLKRFLGKATMPTTNY